MAEDFKKLTREELDELAGEPLPEPAAMSLINANIAAPIPGWVFRPLLAWLRIQKHAVEWIKTPFFTGTTFVEFFKAETRNCAAVDGLSLGFRQPEQE